MTKNSYRTIHTAYGLAKMIAAESARETIQLTEMAVGDGNGNAVQPRESQTYLARERYRGTLNQVYADPKNPSVFTAELIIPSSVGDFVIREIGLIDSTGALFAVANTPDSYKPSGGNGAFGDTVVRMVFAMTNADAVLLNFDPNVVVATHSWVMNSVNAGTVIPGGTTNQVLTKKSNSDGDVEWTDASTTVDVDVSTREESQTLAEGQTVVNPAIVNTHGLGVYINGIRLRAGEFTINGPTRITLAAARTAGDQITLVQNEQTGASEILHRQANLADVPDPVRARENLGIPGYLATHKVKWGNLIEVPDLSVTWSNIQGKPNTFTPSAHGHGWADLTGIPVTATRWPKWDEVTGKPGTYTPANHTHSQGDIQNLAQDLSAKANLSGAVFTGEIGAPSFNRTSDRRRKKSIAPLTNCLATVMRIMPREFVWRSTDEWDSGYIAQELKQVLPHAVCEISHDEEDAILGVRLDTISPYLVGAVQELLKIIEKQDERIKKLESR